MVRDESSTLGVSDERKNNSLRAYSIRRPGVKFGVRGKYRYSLPPGRLNAPLFVLRGFPCRLLPVGKQVVISREVMNEKAV